MNQQHTVLSSLVINLSSCPLAKCFACFSSSVVVVGKIFSSSYEDWSKIQNNSIKGGGSPHVPFPLVVLRAALQ